MIYIQRKECVKTIDNDFMSNKVDTLNFYANFDILQYIHFKPFQCQSRPLNFW